MAVKIKQYALFVIYSDTLEPDEISRRVGLAADEVALRASRSGSRCSKRESPLSNSKRPLRQSCSGRRSPPTVPAAGNAAMDDQQQRDAERGHAQRRCRFEARPLKKSV